MSEDKTKKTMFDTLYEGAEEMLKGLAKPFVKNALRRKFEAAYDQAQIKVDEAHSTLIELRKNNLKDYPLTTVLQQRQVIRDSENLMRDLEAEYADLFGKKLLPRQED